MDWLRSIAPISVLLLIAVGLWELSQPLSRLLQPVARRWALHFALWGILVFLGSTLVRIHALSIAQSRESWIAFPLFLLIYDFCLWLSHFCLHRFGLLWIWHAVHHSDVDFDVTTAVRFHPLEGLWEQIMLAGLVYLLRPSVEATVLTILILVASGYFVHANIALPLKADILISSLLMTPGLHRSHHSVQMEQQNSNYGVLTTIWDRLFGTLRRDANVESLGVDGISADESLSLPRLVFQVPWREWRKL
jgi:sterol desaturase/sphingolipid hydroxylase (fatty acid hydroxylase superfamily)